VGHPGRIPPDGEQTPGAAIASQFSGASGRGPTGTAFEAINRRPPCPSLKRRPCALAELQFVRG
jgi:hypothetical protein